MNPVTQAARVYEIRPTARPFREDLEAHLIHGMVYSNPNAFIMARYVWRDWPPEDIVNPWVNLGPGEVGDCLHIYLASGDLQECFTFRHRPVEWVSFERVGGLRFLPYRSIRSRIFKLIRP